jgi:hypothetical protein
MVRVSNFAVAFLAGASSVVNALPAQLTNEKRAESGELQLLVTYLHPTAKLIQLPLAINGKQQLEQLTTALQQLADTPSNSDSGLNKNAAYAGAAVVGAVGALIGAAIGAYMPPNTTFTMDSIIQGLTSEFTQASAAADAIKQDAGLSIITSLIPKLGGLISSQPNLQRGQPNQQGSYVPPPPPAVIPDAPKPKAVPPPAMDGMAGMDMGAPKPASPPVEPKTPSLPVPATPVAPAAFKPSNPAQRGPKPTSEAPASPATVAAPPAMPAMEGMGGHSHGERRRR